MNIKKKGSLSAPISRLSAGPFSLSAAYQLLSFVFFCWDKQKRGSLSASISRLSAGPFSLSAAYQLLSAVFFGWGIKKMQPIRSYQPPISWAFWAQGLHWPEIFNFFSDFNCVFFFPADQPVGRPAGYLASRSDILTADWLSGPPARLPADWLDRCVAGRHAGYPGSRRCYRYF